MALRPQRWNRNLMFNRWLNGASRRRPCDLRLETLEDRQLLAGDIQILFLGNDSGPTAGADDSVMQFLTDNYGGDNVTYKQASAANNTSDLVDVDLLILSSTAGSGDYRGKYHNAAVPILNWEEAVMDNGSGEFGLSSVQMTKSTTMTDLTIVGNHPITEGLSGTITFLSGGAESLSTSDLYTGLTSVAEAANGTKTSGGGPGGSVTGNPAIFVADTGQAVDPDSGATPAANRRVMFPLTDTTFDSLSAEGLQLFGNAISWLANLTPPAVTNGSAVDVAALSATLQGTVTDTGGETPNVTLYWGDNDGGTNPASWDNAVDLGIQASQFETTLTGLDPSTTYYFTAFAENSSGGAWAAPTESFTTLTLTAPTIITTAATDISVSSALIGGEVTVSGGDTPTITLYWGDNDGGVTPDAWDNAVNLGLQDGAFSWELGGLDAQTTYFYRAFAQNAAGSTWAPVSEAFITLSPLLEDVIMFNDHRSGSRTGDFVTAYAGNGDASGPLLNFKTGDETDFVLTTTGVGVDYGLWSFWPDEGTDAYEIFANRVDFTVGAGAEIALEGNDSYTHAFSNLDVHSRYDFTGTAIRGNGSYDNRWTLVTVVGADSLVPAHSDGIGVVTDGLADNQVAIWTGENHSEDQGFVARWTEIDPGEDGEFEILQQRYTGSIPTSVHAAGVANGSTAYGLTAVRFIKSFAGLAVLNSDPGTNSKFSTSPTDATVNFSAAVDPNTVDVNDLTVDGMPATAVTIVDEDTIRWQLPAGLGVGSHTIELAEGALETADGGMFIGYNSSFFVVTTANVDNVAATEIAATTARVGAQIDATGFDDPTLRVYWGDNDGGTNPANWDNVLDLGLRGVGSHSDTITGLNGTTQYFFRGQVSNLAGEAWAPATATFTSATPVLPDVVNRPAQDVAAFTATLGGEVLSDGNDPPSITVFYGPADGGTDAEAWQNAIDLGKQTATFETFVAGLAKETDYYYRVRATNLAGEQWAATTATFTTTSLPALTISEVAPSNTGDLFTRFRLFPDDEFGAEISPDWIEIHNPSPGPLDLVGLHLTDTANNPTKWQFPLGTVIPANGYLVVYATNQNLRDPTLDVNGNLHTNFVLTGQGEYLALTGGSGEVIFEYAPEIPDTKSGYTYGLDSNGEGAYFGNPTPGAPNDDASIFSGFVADTRFSIDRGFYDDPIIVDITTNTPGATVVYTIDGSEPTLTNGTQVAAPDAISAPVASVNVTTTTAIRARAYLAGYVETNVDTQTYLFLDDVIQQPNRPAGFPTSWGGAPAADYEMDPEVVDDPDYRDDLLAGLREIPTLSINSEIEDIFGSTGLYSNTQNDNLEVPASAELILPDGSSGFQINAGFKVQGGASRNPNRSPKHSLSLRFRDEYGEGELRYPLFEGSPVNSFDSLHLRAMYNNSWIHWTPAQRDRGTLIRDQFVRDLMLDMGQEDAQQGTYMHVYLDGLYWGVYNVHERGEGSHYEAYHGGDAIDALNGGSVIDGTRNSYDAMRDIVRTSGDWEEIQKVLDVDNYIDWTILQRYGSNNDLKADGNWRAAGGGPNNMPWRFYLWDTERILEGVTEGGPGGTADPPGLLSALSQIEEFRIRFADRIQMHFFNDGPLTPDKAADRWNARVDELTNAIVGESARWGDYRRDVHVEGPASLFTRDDYWLPEMNRLRTTYFPQRSGIVVDQYRGLGLYPSVDAPNLQINGADQHGGQIDAGANLGFDADNGTVYYTLDGTDPRAEGGDPAGLVFGAPIALNESTTVNARLRAADGTWSALVTANFIIIPAADVVVISEINYNPYDVTDEETAIIPNLTTNDFEWVEVLNTGATAVNLLDMQFTDGIEFTFPDVSLAPGERAVVVENMAGFEIRYGDSSNVVGQFSGGLANGGERIAMADGIGNTVFAFEFADSDPWPERADGFGGTLVLVDEANVTADLLGKPYSWRGSSEFGGSPGASAAAAFDVVISEVLANSEDVGNGDAIEIHNRGGEAADISGWYLSDAGSDLLKFELPPGTVIPAGGYIVFDESHFNPTPLMPGPRDFALSGTMGDDAWLVIPDGLGGVATIVDDVHFGATAPGESVGRFADSTATPLARPSLGCENSHPRVGPLVITEVHFNPGEPSAAAVAVYPQLVEDDLEFVEIHNPTGAAVDLKDWRLSAGVSETFDESIILNPGETVLVISFNPDNLDNADRVNAFLAHFGLGANDVTLVGGFGGQLSDSGEAVRLRQPTNVLEDEIVYDDREPWGTSADGQGNSLQRVLPTAWGNTPSVWSDVAPTPGEATFLPADGDFDADGQLTAVDINMLLHAIDTGSGVSTFDLDGNGIVDNADTLELLSLLGTLPGDANLDGTVNAVDLNRVGIHWLSSNCASWERGDFSGDGKVDAVDLNIVGLNWLAAAAQPAQTARVPRAPLGLAAPAVDSAITAVRPSWRQPHAALESPRVQITHVGESRPFLSHPCRESMLRRSGTVPGLQDAPSSRDSSQNADRISSLDAERIDDVFAGLDDRSA